MVGGDRVAQHDQYARVFDVGQRHGFAGQALEKWRLLDIGRLRIPLVQVAVFRQRQRPPVLVAVEHLGVLVVELVWSDGHCHRLADLGLRRPQIA